MLSWNALYFTEAEEQGNRTEYVYNLFHSLCSIHFLLTIALLIYVNLILTVLLLVVFLAYRYCL
jgi:hypothetical protein